MCSDTSSCSHCCQRAEDLQYDYRRVHYLHLKVVHARTGALWAAEDNPAEWWQIIWGRCDPRSEDSHADTPYYQPSDMITALAPWSRARLSPLLWFLMIPSCRPEVIKQDARLRKRLDPGATFVKSHTANGNNLSNIFCFIQGEWGCFTRYCFFFPESYFTADWR